jgi:hypothetical protein
MRQIEYIFQHIFIEFIERLAYVNTFERLASGERDIAG